MSTIKKAIEKVSGSRGETIVETLVSILISSLALLMLATAIGSSVKIIMTSTRHMETFYNGQSAMVADAYTGTGTKGTVSLDVPLNKKDGSSIAVNVFQNEKDTNIILYKRDAS
jgi:hypothetical protein